jgi:pSer/pThr/pTyr-binding forkhead associated (FHA) protein
MAMDVALVMFRADGERRKFAVKRNMTVIGRREDCDLRIPLGDVSRKHCRLIRDGDVIRIEDLGSSNGTYVDGEKVKDGTLFAGSSVRVGPVTFVVQIDGVPAEEDMKPTPEKPVTLDDSDFLAVSESQAGAAMPQSVAAESDDAPAAEAEEEVSLTAPPKADEASEEPEPEPEHAPVAEAADADPEDSVAFEFDLSDGEPAQDGKSIDDLLEFHLEEEEASPSASGSGKHQA